MSLSKTMRCDTRSYYLVSITTNTRSFYEVLLRSLVVLSLIEVSFYQ